MSTVFVLAVAEVHGVPVHDIERRRTLLLTIQLGDTVVSIMEQAAGRTGPYRGRQFTKAVPLSTIRRINKVLGRNFVTKYGTKQGIIVIGRLAPFGVGAAIGGVGSALAGRGVIGGARRAFGPAPAQFPPSVQI